MQKFYDTTKYAMIICNETYRLMNDLPAVKNDLRNAKNLSKMIGIPDENIKVLKDASYESVEELFEWFIQRIKVLTKPLKNETGIH